MSEQIPDDVPDPHDLADPEDTLGWDRAVHGKMADQQAPDDAVATEPC